jgi:flagellar assembly protein FliH
MSSATDGGAELWRRWSAPDLTGQPGRGMRDPDFSPPTAEELEVVRHAAYEEGLAAGRSDGLRQGAEEARAKARELHSLIASLARPLALLDARVEDELVALAIALTRALVRREIRTDPGVVVGAVREALAVLPLSAREVAVKLHPDDAALLREVHPDGGSDSGPGWRILESPALTRGGCVVVTSTSEVDATVEGRLAAAISHVFGGERVSDTRPAADQDLPATGRAGATTGGEGGR